MALRIERWEARLPSVDVVKVTADNYREVGEFLGVLHSSRYRIHVGGPWEFEYQYQPVGKEGLDTFAIYENEYLVREASGRLRYVTDYELERLYKFVGVLLDPDQLELDLGL